MKIFEIATPKKRMLAEAKARIDHPEDIIFDEGIEGARRALEAIKHASVNPSATTVKWDGKPAIIWGRDENGQFVLTDKSGFGAKGYQGRATSMQQLAGIMQARGGERAVVNALNTPREFARQHGTEDEAESPVEPRARHREEGDKRHGGTRRRGHRGHGACGPDLEAARSAAVD